MSAARLTTPLAIVLILSAPTPLGAQASNAVPPPASEVHAPEKSSPMTAPQAVDKVNTATDLLFRGALLTAPKAAIDETAKMGGKFFENVGKDRKSVV